MHRKYSKGKITNSTFKKARNQKKHEDKPKTNKHSKHVAVNMKLLIASTS
tara:strand:+ start:279 stop:428 length:150 start_codon:yes stop_codon:yes gene_type:complete